MMWANVMLGKTADTFLELQMVERVGQKKEFELLWRDGRSSCSDTALSLKGQGGNPTFCNCRLYSVQPCRLEMFSKCGSTSLIF